jgi:hypothetical protein
MADSFNFSSLRQSSALPAKNVASLLPQQKSLMKDLLLRDLTLEQTADLLNFLAGLK